MKNRCAGSTDTTENQQKKKKKNAFDLVGHVPGFEKTKQSWS